MIAKHLMGNAAVMAESSAVSAEITAILAVSLKKHIKNNSKIWYNFSEKHYIFPEKYIIGT